MLSPRHSHTPIRVSQPWTRGALMSEEAPVSRLCALSPSDSAWLDKVTACTLFVTSNRATFSLLRWIHSHPGGCDASARWFFLLCPPDQFDHHGATCLCKKLRLQAPPHRKGLFKIRLFFVDPVSPRHNWGFFNVRLWPFSLKFSSWEWASS